jgi:hypothetical protein
VVLVKPKDNFTFAIGATVILSEIYGVFLSPRERLYRVLKNAARPSFPVNKIH